MSELADVIALVEAFEEQNNCTLNFQFSLNREDRAKGMVISVMAHGGKTENLDQPFLAFVSVSSSALNLKHWNAALTHVLYALDFKLALSEFEKNAPKRA